MASLRAWATAVYSDLPRGANLEDLLPDRWLTKNPTHRWTIADRRKEEVHAKTQMWFTVRLLMDSRNAISHSITEPRLYRLSLMTAA